jgi:hypothetical protein
VTEPDELEATGQALGEAPLDQERRRSEDDDTKVQACPLVLVPQPLDDLRPGPDLLDLVEDQQGPPAGGACQDPAGFPLRL